MSVSSYIKHLIAFVVALAITTAIFISFETAHQATASAPSGAPATIATSTNPNLPALSATTIIASSTCSARIISTASTTIMLTFADGFTPSATFGTFQAASTTKEYDSGQYGCGMIKAYAFTAGLITVIDAR